jgi:hypothetical protein
VLLVALPLAVMVAPVILSGARSRRPASPNRRGFWLGMCIGSSIVLIVGGGLCVALLSATSQLGG